MVLIPPASFTFANQLRSPHLTIITNAIRAVSRLEMFETAIKSFA